MSSNQPEPVASPTSIPAGSKSLVVAGGCFWCLETIYDQLVGVIDTESGYAGGKTAKTTYEQVCMGNTGHAEVIKITYDPAKITEKELLNIFFTFHNPTTLNRQGPDSGTQYRSAIFYANPEEKKLAEDVIAQITKEKIWKDPIVTTVEPLVNYSRAEEYHQDYFEKFEKSSLAQKMTMNAGYCSAIIEPKVKKFRVQFASKLKKKS
ncbi:MAG: peptide-methionine (S)-S-oxide reductase MsrA [Fimbriimonas sp.]